MSTCMEETVEPRHCGPAGTAEGGSGAGGEKTEIAPPKRKRLGEASIPTVTLIVFRHLSRVCAVMAYG